MTGRPRTLDSARRQREMLRLLSSGMTWREAAEVAKVAPDTVLGLLDRTEFRPVAVTLIQERIDEEAA